MTLGAYTLAPGQEWTDIAARWPLRLEIRDTEPGHWHTDVVHIDLAGQHVTQAHLTCGACSQSVAPLSPDVSKPSYFITDEQIRSGILRHIRQCHEDSPPPKP